MPRIGSKGFESLGVERLGPSSVGTVGEVLGICEPCRHLRSRIRQLGLSLKALPF